MLLLVCKFSTRVAYELLQKMIIFCYFLRIQITFVSVRIYLLKSNTNHYYEDTCSRTQGRTKTVF